MRISIHEKTAQGYIPSRPCLDLIPSPTNHDRCETRDRNLAGHSSICSSRVIRRPKNDILPNGRYPSAKPRRLQVKLISLSPAIMCFIIMRPPAQIYTSFTGVFAGGGGPTANVSGLTGKINGSGNSAGLRVYLLLVGGHGVSENYCQEQACRLISQDCSWVV